MNRALDSLSLLLTEEIAHCQFQFLVSPHSVYSSPMSWSQQPPVFLFNEKVVAFNLEGFSDAGSSLLLLSVARAIKAARFFAPLPAPDLCGPN
mmetsp:Transcript_113751/g.232746  ORF Transcript_113751/g.232746 Transcript_113751/m.232746 type:complete len:93 (-) Transcript_113751:2353-2631(-)